MAVKQEVNARAAAASQEKEGLQDGGNQGVGTAPGRRGRR